MRLVRSAVSASGICTAILAVAAVALTAAAATTALAAPRSDSGPARPALAPRASASPASAQPGQAVTFRISCEGAKSATLFGATLGLPEQIPMGLGMHDGEFTATVTLSQRIAPGTYSPSIDCDNGQSAQAQLMVNALPGKGAQTGDGTASTATDETVTAAGLVLLGLGAVIGGFALRQRRSASRS